MISGPSNSGDQTKLLPRRFQLLDAISCMAIAFLVELTRKSLSAIGLHYVHGSVFVYRQ